MYALGNFLCQVMPAVSTDPNDRDSSVRDSGEHLCHKEEESEDKKHFLKWCRSLLTHGPGSAATTATTTATTYNANDQANASTIASRGMNHLEDWVIVLFRLCRDLLHDSDKLLASTVRCLGFIIAGMSRVRHMKINGNMKGNGNGKGHEIEQQEQQQQEQWFDYLAELQGKYTIVRLAVNIDCINTYTYIIFI